MLGDFLKRARLYQSRIVRALHLIGSLSDPNSRYLPEYLEVRIGALEMEVGQLRIWVWEQERLLDQLKKSAASAPKRSRTKKVKT